MRDGEKDHEMRDWCIIALIWILTAVAIVAITLPAHAHDQFTGKMNGSLGCCSGQDCIAGHWKMRRTENGYDIYVPTGSHPFVRDEPWEKREIFKGAAKGEMVPGVPNGGAWFHFEGEPFISKDTETYICIWFNDVALRRVRCLFTGGAV